MEFFECMECGEEQLFTDDGECTECGWNLWDESTVECDLDADEESDGEEGEIAFE
jgi:predicted ATP-dependent serine protease